VVAVVAESVLVAALVGSALVLRYQLPQDQNTPLPLALAVRLGRLLELPTQDKATILFLAPLLPLVEVKALAAN
jgi:hypothetical protein